VGKLQTPISLLQELIQKAKGKGQNLNLKALNLHYIVVKVTFSFLLSILTFDFYLLTFILYLPFASLGSHLRPASTSRARLIR
jgi:hypothetical protein